MTTEQQNKQILRETISALRGVPAQQMADLLAAVDRGEITAPGGNPAKERKPVRHGRFLNLKGQCES